MGNLRLKRSATKKRVFCVRKKTCCKPMGRCREPSCPSCLKGCAVHVCILYRRELVEGKQCFPGNLRRAEER